MDIDNQKEYWDKVADIKTFTHPLDIELINTYLNNQSIIVDFGCGYGRTLKQLADLGFEHISGFDSSKELIARGISEYNLPLYHIDTPASLMLADNSVDCILLFAVLTCIPSNEGQMELIKLLYSKLKPGAVIYISDYYLQEDYKEVKRYGYLNNNQDNYGVFTLSEGVTFRHHTQEWVNTLMNNFEILSEKQIAVQTMNGNEAKAFQLIGKKDESAII